MEVPKPLVIFGYGSLCWRPDTTLEGFESFPCVLPGWSRFFAQRSTDHRGTPAAPGLVVTVVKDEDLAQLPGGQTWVGGETTGVAYRVPDQEVNRVLSELDFREKGGYTREAVEVTPVDGSTSVKALLYTGTIDNPNFWWGPENGGLSLEQSAKIIAEAHGPSGPNIDYFDNLLSFLKSLDRVDEHMRQLETLVTAQLALPSDAP